MNKLIEQFKNVISGVIVQFLIMASNSVDKNDKNTYIPSVTLLLSGQLDWKNLVKGMFGSTYFYVMRSLICDLTNFDGQS